MPALAAGGAGARYWTADGRTHVLGVITPMSRHFCAACNRVRLGDGTLYLCLGQEDQVPLGMLRGASDAELRGALGRHRQASGTTSTPGRARAALHGADGRLRCAISNASSTVSSASSTSTTRPRLRCNLRDGQRTLLIGCCDSRVDPAMLLGCDPGDIFTVRNVANLVPPADRDQGHHGVLAAIQFAVDQLKVGRIIVLGHAHCGGIRADGRRRRRADYLNRWMDIAEPARQRVLNQMPDASDAERRRACNRRPS